MGSRAIVDGAFGGKNVADLRIDVEGDRMTIHNHGLLPWKRRMKLELTRTD